MTPQQYKKQIQKASISKNKAYKKHLQNLPSKPFFKEREALNSIRISNRSGSHVNCFRYHKNNTKLHEIKKFEIYMGLIDLGHNLIVEPIFENGMRADILDLTDNTCYEIVNSETEASLVKKEKHYPFPIEVIKVDK